MDAEPTPIRIIEERCTACGCCAEACPGEVLAPADGGIVATHPENCGGCGQCELVCPENAIELSFAILWDDDDCTDTDEQGGPRERPSGLSR